MGNLGFPEMLVILVVALLVFGPGKLPEIGKSLGKALADFKRASNDLKQTWEDEVRADQEKEVTSQTRKNSTDTNKTDAMASEEKENGKVV